MKSELSEEIQAIIDKNRKINANNHHCLVRRLRNRSIGRKLPNANFAQNIPLNGSLTKVLVPQNCSPKRFSPCGKFMIALGDHSVELYRFKGSDSVVETRQKFREEMYKLQQQPPIHDRTRLSFVTQVETQKKFCGESDIESYIDNALTEPITILGNELYVAFETDTGTVRGGFDLKITVNLDNSCSSDSNSSAEDSADDTVQMASCFDGQHGGCSHHCSASVCSCPPCWTLGADGKQCEFEAGKAQVMCSGAGAKITIDKCALVGIDQNSIHLTDTTCYATEENADSWKIVTGFSDCGTQLGFSEDKFTLQNTLTLGYAVVGGRVVSRKYEIDFSCNYNNIAAASSTIQASNVFFGFGLSFYESDAYTTQADLTNGAFQPGNPLFGRIAPTSALADSLEFSVGKCTVEDKIISESLVILNTCPVDGTNFAFQDTQSDTTAVEFSFEGFVFPTSADDTTIDVSCEVNVCEGVRNPSLDNFVLNNL
ncbi:unnamed protein product [Oikopleura dioica]|uniref:ZP domain-containing protein n=1 Tax=Oikopleura dioica TaxID=34765 RepID=E4XPR6_OIKDI|nr:unnamed protein product [Oikopleura dioica]